MKRILLAAAGIALIASACKKENQMVDTDRPALAKTTWAGVDTIAGVVESGDTLKLWSDTLYYLNSKLFVKDGGVLWIEKGTRVMGVKKSTPAEATAIVITRGGKIYAQGTSQKPIIFTAATFPNAMPGDWGGLVILGKAVTNQANPTIEGINLPTLPPGVDVNYGGTNDFDNSGIVTYVRLEYAGALVSPNNELNALTTGGVGAATVINHIEAIYGADDGFEFFGGRHNASHLIAYANNDDQFDFDFGFRGSLQFIVGVIAEQIPGLTTGLYSANPNGIECDNDGTGSNATPKTWPVISNMTLVGAKDSTTANSLGLLYGNQWRRRAKFTVRNSIIIGYKRDLDVTSDTSLAVINKKKPNGTPDAANANFKNNFLMAFKENYNSLVTSSPLPASNTWKISTDGNIINTATPTSGVLVNPFPLDPNALASGLEPKNSGVKTGANFVNFSGFTVVPFKGGVGNVANNWLYESWVDFTP